MVRIGVIGFGTRIKMLVGDLYKLELDAEIVAVADTDSESVREKLKELNIDEQNIHFYTDYLQMMDNEQLDGVMIGTRCSTHSKIACDVFKYAIPVFLEKPVAVTMDDLLMLKEANETYAPKVVVSFPLRVSQIVELAKDIISSGTIGTVENVQAVNNVPYGGVYFHNWYRNETETGGLFLQKATHDFDYINCILGYQPTMICAMEAKQIFKGNRDDVYCKDCRDYYTCPESPYVMKHYKCDDSNGDMCCFAKDTGNHDSASVIVKYHTGMIATYAQNFFARKSAAKRGGRFFGYKGTLEFDWVTDELKVHMHSVTRTDTYKFNTASMVHAGGDVALMRNFVEVIRKQSDSIAPLEAGLQSVLMCLKAKESAASQTFVAIHY